MSVCDITRGLEPPLTRPTRLRGQGGDIIINDQQQYEWRWVVEAMLQANQVVSVPQQFADQVTVEIISVDASYPPS